MLESGHAVQFEKPKELAEQVFNFIQGVSSFLRI